MRSNGSGSLPASFSVTKRRTSGILLRAAHQQHAVDVLGTQAAQLQRLVDGRARLHHQRHDGALERRPVDLFFQVQMPFGNQLGLAGHGRRLRGQLDLGPLDGQHELLLVRRVQDVVAFLLLEALGQYLRQSRVDVVAAEFADALARQLLEHAVMDVQNGHVERTAAEVVDEYRLIVLGVEAVTDGGGRRLVDERQHLHPGRAGAELGGVAGQTLAVGGDGDDGLGEVLADDLLGVLLEHAEQHDGDLFGAQVLADERHALGGTEDALDGADRALLVEVFLGLRAEGQGAVAAQRDDRGRPFLALVVGHHLRLAVLEVGHDRVAGAEVDADVGHGKPQGRGQGSAINPYLFYGDCLIGVIRRFASKSCSPLDSGACARSKRIANPLTT